MLFNSWEYGVFFAVTFLLYNALTRHKLQNILLVTASYFFYAAWDWRLCLLPFGASVFNFIAGLQIDAAKAVKVKRRWLIGSLVFNLGILCFFKYYNFFLDSLTPILEAFGTSVRSWHLQLVLPIGISFYTFLVMTYTIDIYRGLMKPTRTFLDFSLFVGFFPQLLAGPITRAKELIPQIANARSLSIEKVQSGCWLILWGIYKKVVIADNVAMIADRIFEGSAGATLCAAYVGALAFTVQIYCDFSGYTDIARGSARLLGFQLMRNFDLPYFASNPREFWSRWHISLSTWLRDYLYIPLGGNRKGSLRTFFNLFLTMTLGGLWHGASYNYVLWGMYHGLLLIGHRVISKETSARRFGAGLWSHSWKVFLMFQCSVFGWLLFRSNRMVVEGSLVRDDSLSQVMELILSLRNGLGLTWANLESLGTIIVFSMPLVVVQILEARSGNHYFMLGWTWSLARAAFYGSILFMLMIWGVTYGDSFVYFQF